MCTTALVFLSESGYASDMDLKTTQISSLQALRTIANPARIHLYEVLSRRGRSRVSELAGEAGLAVGSASYHLQQMHKVGLVAEVSDASGDGREHWWEAVPGGVRWSPADFLGSPGGQEVASAAAGFATERLLGRLARWHETWQGWGRDWVDATLESDMILSLTADEMRELGAELQAVIGRWSAAKRPQASAHKSEPSRPRKPVFTFLCVIPLADEP